MFKSVKELDSLKVEQTHYYLTQGDSCIITSTPYKNGEPATNIKSCMFKLANTNYIQVFSKEMTEDNGSYVLDLASSDTEGLEPGTYIYEIEYTMNDDEIQTPHSWKFDIVKQIKTQTTTN